MAERTGLLAISSLAIFIIFLLSNTAYSYASSDFQSVDVQAGNKTYNLGYYMSNGGSIDGIYANDKTESLTIAIANTPASIGQDSDNDYYLDLTFPRELYDELNFTEHELVAFADGEFVDVIVESSMISCDQITVRIQPIDPSVQEIEIVHDEILGAHTHTYPPKLWLFKTIEVGRGSNSTEFSVLLRTDAIGCDVSFSAEQKKIHIDIEGTDAEEVVARGGVDKGYLSLNFPYDLLGGNYTVLVDGKPITFNESQYFTKNYTDIVVQSVEQDDFTPIKASRLSFNYSMNAEAVDIIGTTAAPEFGVVAPFVMAAATVSAITILKWFRPAKW